MVISAVGGSLAAGYIENLALISEEPAPAGRPFLLSPRPVGLAGREGLLAMLHDSLSAGDGPQKLRIVALHGMGGVGKTSVAVEYAHRHEPEFGVVWQFAAEDPVVLEAGFARLSALLATAGGLAEPQDPVGSVHAVLADSQLPWLLVFDNAPDPVSVREFLPGGGPGQVLITSQHALWPAGQGVEVPVLDVDVAARYLVNRSRDPDLAAARDLAAELDGLPLALEQAGAYIDAAGISLADYRVLFKDRRAELLARGGVAGHPAGVAATIWVALSQLEADAAATGLLRLLACLAPEPVPVGLILSGGGAASAQGTDVAASVGLLGDKLAIGDAMAALRRYSLVTPAGAGLVAVHRLVQAVIVESMPGGLAARWRRAVASLAEAAIPESASRPESWPVFAALLPHIRYLVPDVSIGMAKMASYLGNAGDAMAARDLLVRVVSARERALGSEHPMTLAARADLAMWTGRAGDPASARDMYADLVPVRERMLGPDHLDTLAARSSLAVWTGESGDPAAARDMLTELLPVRERVSGPEHPYTLAARRGFVLWTAKAGDLDAARED